MQLSLRQSASSVQGPPCSLPSAGDSPRGRHAPAHSLHSPPGSQSLSSSHRPMHVPEPMLSKLPTQLWAGVARIVTAPGVLAAAGGQEQDREEERVTSNGRDRLEARGCLTPPGWADPDLNRETRSAEIPSMGDGEGPAG